MKNYLKYELESCFCCIGFHNTKHAMIKAWIKLWLRPLGESLHQIPLSRAMQSRTRGFKITTRAEVLRIADTKLHTQLATRKDGPKDRQKKNNNPTARHNSRRRGIKTNNAKKKCINNNDSNNNGTAKNHDPHTGRADWTKTPTPARTHRTREREREREGERAQHAGSAASRSLAFDIPPPSARSWSECHLDQRGAATATITE